ncbi:hypothetical protein NC653_010291 [Populus alba x Populus x berolinensis]|uniref:THH1/TOM1/TOM3 domain-containing protein n=1 Tax=Populus alba x Populus x berolinensis TaxID=444605 RepID=A0AAD6QZG1_9ROSI|nr:hypothetical protein NC653_010291 [Populus alba x Populus x berolinensis]
MGRISKMPVELPAMEIGAMVGDWWEEINESTQWQDGIFYALCGAYALVSAVALIQLIRIELRVPEYGWTTQKVFHLMNFIVNGVRAIVFGFHKQVFTMNPQALVLVLLDLPGLLFFSTYTLLVLFWAEIYHQASVYIGARSLPTDKLRVVYISVNVAMYFVQVCIWVYLWVDDNSIVELIGKIFIAVVSILAALGFLVYGGRQNIKRCLVLFTHVISFVCIYFLCLLPANWHVHPSRLFFMLRRFPIESKGRRKKLHEVWCISFLPSIAFNLESIHHITKHDWINCIHCQGCNGSKISFLIYTFQRLTFLITGCIVKIISISFSFNSISNMQIFLSAFDADASLDVLDHPVLNLIYYMLVEILPSALVLFILRKLPPKRISAQYHPIR